MSLFLLLKKLPVEQCARVSAKLAAKCNTPPLYSNLAPGETEGGSSFHSAEEPKWTVLMFSLCFLGREEGV